MERRLSNLYAMSTSIRKISDHLFMIWPTKKPSTCFVLLFNSWKIRAYFRPGNAINRQASSILLWWKNIARKMRCVTCAGVETIKWNYKKLVFSIENTKARIGRSGFGGYLLRIGKIKSTDLLYILAFSVFTCKRQYGKSL